MEELSENVGFQKKLDGPKDKNFVYPEDYKEKFIKNKDLPVNILKFQYNSLINVF